MMFAVGMLVRLKSGGPKMTVKESSAAEVRCSWFAKEDDLMVASFAPLMLEPVEPVAES